MGKVPARIVFDVDYNNLELVIALAKALGPGMSVIKYPTRINYNITHTSREVEATNKGAVVYHRT